MDTSERTIVETPKQITRRREHASAPTKPFTEACSFKRGEY
jgi:hypothetical protein